MYLETFGLREPPFGDTPDPRFACLFTRERDILAHIEYELGAADSGITLVTGEQGVGKTLLCMLIEADAPNHGVTVVRHGAGDYALGTVGWLRSMYAGFGLPLPLSAEANTEDHLVDGLAAGLGRLAHHVDKRFLLLLDDGDDLSDIDLADIERLLVACAKNSAPMYVVLAGTTAFRDRLTGAAISARIRSRLPLVVLNEEESERYVRHRLHVAGTSQMPFSRLGLRSLRDDGKGNPRRLNTLAHRALERAAERGEQSIGERALGFVAREVLPQYARYWLRRYRKQIFIGAATLAALFLIGSATWFFSGRSPSRPKNLVTATPDQALAKFKDALPDPEAGKVRVWGELLARWQVTSRETSVANAIHCDAVIFPGFACVSGRGSIDQLRRFDRPMVLELDDADGKQQVLMVGAGDEAVRLYLGGKYVELTRDAFEHVWNGRFYAVFRIDPAMPAKLSRGDTGDGVRWLLAHLPSNGNAGPASATAFDRSVESRVRSIQQRFGISADGVVGPETMFALSSLETEGPHLARGVP
ncbi:MAG: putative general secretion pathway protein A [Luteibacter sp.]|uniref:ExeA family protein n=1 Tax=Luteibacter sp. TaxID=1886636 RepID=UPI001381DC5B|nr:ExeA family protein [Luteibacter sp.]KAF1005687.1 MAG: putative general secretion pathway protein A [Luteibacter sp.]